MFVLASVPVYLQWEHNKTCDVTLLNICPTYVQQFQPGRCRGLIITDVGILLSLVFCWLLTGPWSPEWVHVFCWCSRPLVWPRHQEWRQRTESGRYIEEKSEEAHKGDENICLLPTLVQMNDASGWRWTVCVSRGSIFHMLDQIPTRWLTLTSFILVYKI